MKNITIAGNCTRDAELRTTQGGHKLASFSVAVNGYSNGEKTTTFFDVSIFGKRGDAVQQFAKRGAKICVSGELGTREYNGKTYLTVNAHDFTPMGGGSDHGSSGGYSAPASDDMGDSIPF
jgi:single-strand DNA-binding protein